MHNFSKTTFLSKCVKKVSELHLYVLLFSNRWEKVPKLKEKGHWCVQYFFFILFITFFSWLEKNNTVQYSSDSFQCILTTIFFIQNCQNYISVHHCPLIVEKLPNSVYFMVTESENSTSKFKFSKISQCEKSIVHNYYFLIFSPSSLILFSSVFFYLIFY